jgi:hypothetical protein
MYERRSCRDPWSGVRDPLRTRNSKRLRPERERVGVGPHAQLEMQTETRNDSITDS